MDKFNFNTDTPLSDEDLEKLDAFLQSDRVPEGTLWLDELDGLFAALICGPRVVHPSEWLPVVWNRERPEWKTKEEFQGIFEMMMRQWNAVARDINAGEYEPILRHGINDAGEDVDDPAGWCYGFIEGVSMWGVDDWEDEELRTLITPMVALRDEEMEDEPDDELAAAVREPGVRERFIDMLPDSVEEIRLYWIEHPAPEIDIDPDLDDGLAPGGRQAPKIPKRNDPCPCGSGRKYKFCCGADA